MCLRSVRFEVLTTVTVKSAVFWVVTVCSGHKGTDVSEEFAAVCSDDESSKFL
jgi:hypothetical protein